ncbi:MAG: urease accessory protein UreE [Deltaproteobacteria bacterium]|nr:urease accessory protein UreE [Deltaproteobacteria bacterium]
MGEGEEGLRLTVRLGAVSDAAAELWLDWESRRRTRMAVTLSDGRSAWVQLERPLAGQVSVLADGEGLAGPGGLVVRVRAQPEPLWEVRADGPDALARCAYHLGNRHAHVEVGEGCLRTPADPVMRAMLEQLGAAVTAVEAPFSPEVGAYAHQGDHVHRHGHGVARIHSFTRPR